ncbi:MAG: VanZ family protein [Cellulomonas sp.]
MQTRRRSLIRGALAAAILLAAVLTLSPLPVQDLAFTTIDRVLGVLHAWGAPARLDRHVLELAANIALFVPLTLLAALLVPKRTWWLVLVGAVLASLAVETVQARALPQRIGSLRDVLSNTLGAVIGIALAAVWRAAGRRRGRQAMTLPRERSGEG